MQESASFRLIVRRGPQPNQSFDLNKDVVTLGRDITNDIVINDPEVSRHHLRFTRGADGYNIEDLGSTNGTFIGGQRLSGVRPLNRGELIGLGETVTLAYDVVRPEGSAAPPGAAATMPSPAPQGPPAVPPQNPYAQPPAAPPQDPYGAPPPAAPPQDPYGAPPPAAPPQPAYGAQPPTPAQPAYGADPYGQPQQPDYDQGYAQDDYAYAGGPAAPPGYDYDPYAMREDEGGATWRWVVIGCAGLTLFCCCATIVGLVIVDTGDLWCDIPVVREVIRPIFGLVAEALGIIEETQSCG